MMLVPYRYRLVAAFVWTAVCIALAGCGATNTVSPSRAYTERTIEVRVGERVGPLKAQMDGGGK